MEQGSDDHEDSYDRVRQALCAPRTVERAMLVLVGLVAGLAIGLLFSSKASNGATILAGVLVAVGTSRTSRGDPGVTLTTSSTN